jgi:hypothetical protein
MYFKLGHGGFRPSHYVTLSTASLRSFYVYLTTLLITKIVLM